MKPSFSPTTFLRAAFFLTTDLIVMAGSLFFALVFFSDPGHVFLMQWPTFLVCVFIVSSIKIASLSYFKLYTITWRYVGIRELTNALLALFVASPLVLSVTLIWNLSPVFMFNIPMVVCDAVLSFMGILGIRIAKRVYLEVFFHGNKKEGQGKPTLILGAGNTGEMILRDGMKQRFSSFNPLVFLDDDPVKKGMYIHGIKVDGGTHLLCETIQKYDIEAIIIAIPSLNFKTLQNIYKTAKEAGINTIKIVPRIYDFHQPNISLKSLEDIKIEDLIGRQKVDVDYDEISGFISQKCLLITGAGGSIGSEIVRQVSAFDPRLVVLLEIDETELHTLHLQLKRQYPHLFFNEERIKFVVGDIRDKELVERVFKKYKPDLVFHAAAYKHVPMMEWNPEEAVKVNMLGTSIIAEQAVRHGVEKFVMISTDKAVMPTSIMGATKRMAEYICKAYNQRAYEQQGSTEFVSVRFGNVLGSRGSILPLFMEQLSYGGPLTVTHKDMKRYFMTIPEAVSLVLQASIIGKGGEVMVLDMGDPIKITKLAEELIKIHGLEPYKDIDTEFVGLRPGEKLFEEILTAEEGTQATQHKKVFIAKGNDGFSLENVTLILNEFKGILTEDSAPHSIRTLLKKYIKHYEEE
jgi:FlaA1/EpsC-like NDP-sugar epimerase